MSQSKPTLSVSDTDIPTPEEMIARARAMIPSLRDRAEQCEQERKVPDVTFEEFKQAGFFNVCKPKEFGGYEMDPTVAFEITIELAKGCSSSAWCYGVVHVHNWEMALFPHQAAVDVWGEDQSVLISSSYAPTGKVELTDGGFNIWGRWAFSSGSDHCDWVILGGIPPENSKGELLGGVFLLPRSDYEIEDTWHVAGLCGTGSKDIVVEKAFVPFHRAHSPLVAYEMKVLDDQTSSAAPYRFPFGIVFGNAIAATTIGMAEGALETYLEQARKKVQVFDGAKTVEDPFAQHRAAAAKSAIEGVKRQMFANFDEMRTYIAEGTPIPVERRAQFRWDASNMTRTNANTVRELFLGMGGRGLYLSNPMQRFFRDTHAASVHAFLNAEKMGVNQGRVQFGLENQEMAL